MEKFDELQKEFNAITNDYQRISDRSGEIVAFIEKATSLYGLNAESNKQLDEMVAKVKLLIQDTNEQGEVLKERAKDWINKNKE